MLTLNNSFHYCCFHYAQCLKIISLERSIFPLEDHYGSKNLKLWSHLFLQFLIDKGNTNFVSSGIPQSTGTSVDTIIPPLLYCYIPVITINIDSKLIFVPNLFIWLNDRTHIIIFHDPYINTKICCFSTH